MDLTVTTDLRMHARTRTYRRPDGDVESTVEEVEVIELGQAVAASVEQELELHGLALVSSRDAIKWEMSSVDRQ